MKKRYIPALLAAAGAAFAVCGLDNTLTLQTYTVRSPKITRPFHIVFLSDLHSEKFKDGGERLFSLIDDAHPDCVVLGGDIFDKYDKPADRDRTFQLLRQLRERHDACYFVTGNHELESRCVTEITQKLAYDGFRILGEESFVVTGVTGQKILLGGVDYRSCEEEPAYSQKRAFLREVGQRGLFSVLARHVPMFAPEDASFDLILSGHNHGGLWRFPHTDIGAAGGGKTLLPRFAHGEYHLGDTTLIVGSGVSTKTYLLPRLYNVPEVVQINLSHQCQ